LGFQNHNSSLSFVARSPSYYSILSQTGAQKVNLEIKSPQELIDDIAENNKAKIKKMEERQ